MANDCGNIFDLVITPEKSSLVTATSDATTHHLFNHSLVVCVIKLGHNKTVVPTRLAINIKAIDKVDFVRRLRGSSPFTNPANTIDGYTDQIERLMKRLCYLTKQVLMLYGIYSIKNFHYSIINSIIILRLKLFKLAHGSSI